MSRISRKHHFATDDDLNALEWRLFLTLVFVGGWVLIQKIPMIADRLTPPVVVFGYILLVAGLVWVLLQPSSFKAFSKWTRIIRVVPWLFMVVALACGVQLAQYSFALSARPVSDSAEALVCIGRDIVSGHDPYVVRLFRCDQQVPLNQLDLPTPLDLSIYSHARGYPSVALQKQVLSGAYGQRVLNRVYPPLAYPPLGALWLLPVLGLPFHWVGVWLTLLVFLWMLLMGREAGRAWPFAVAALGVQVLFNTVSFMAVMGNAEVVPYALATLSLALVRHPKRSAALLGLAVASNQIIWLLVLPYLPFTRRLPGFGSRLGWLVGTAALATLPWLIFYPNMLHALLSVFTMPDFNSGAGLTGIFGAGNLPQTVKIYFTGAMILAYFVWAWMAYRSPKWALCFVPLATAVTWLGWRGDSNYLYLVLPLTVGMIIGISRLDPEQVATSD